MVDLETNYLGLTYLNSVEDCGFHQLYGFFIQIQLKWSNINPTQLFQKDQQFYLTFNLQ